MDERMVSYAGKNYLLLGQTRTRHGRRALLGFLRGDERSFWVAWRDVQPPINPCYSETYPY